MVPNLKKIKLFYARMAYKNIQSTGSSSKRPNNFPQLSNINKKVHYEPSNNIPQRFAQYEKLKESSDYGKEFEQLMCALYALKLSDSDDVEDFEMTANNKKCGKFDDIELIVNFKGSKKRHYLFQLKHKENEEKKITLYDILNDKKGNFYLWKYLNSLWEIPINDAICILYTNSSTDFPYNMPPNVKQCSEVEYGELLLNLKTSATSPAVFELFGDRKKYYFFTQQENVHSVKSLVENWLKRIVFADIYASLLLFMKEWWSGNFVLRKHDFITKIVEMALSPYIKTLTAGRYNHKSEKLTEFIMKFEMTIVEEDDGIIENVWFGVEQHYDLTMAMKKFGVTTKEPSAMQKCKILWHLDCVPLVVRVEDFSKVKTSLLFLRKSLGNKRLVLVGKIDQVEVQMWKVFRTLSDLNVLEKEGNLSYIHKNFNVSLQGQKSIPLEQLIQLDAALAATIGTQQLLTMCQEDFLYIGDEKEEFSFYHIPRTVTTKFIKSRILLGFYKYAKDSLLIVSCNEDEKRQLENSLEVVNLCDYLKHEDKENYGHVVLVCNDQACSSTEFEEVCKQSKLPEVYYFQIYDSDCWMLLMNKGNKLISKEVLYMDNAIKEDKIFRHFRSRLNVTCAPPGMGKSRLLLSLRSNHGRPDLWSVYIQLINHKKFFQTLPDHETMLSYLMKIDDTKNDFLSKFKKAFVRNKKVLLFLDGLDEVDYKFVFMVLQFVKHVTANGSFVWMSARENLTSLIFHYLHIVPIKIVEFSSEDQREYLENRLNVKFQPDEVENIVKTIIQSAEVTNSRQLLGIPLQLYIITETLLTSDKACESINEENMFILTKMYREFFNGKKKFSLEKLGMDQYEEQLGLNFEHHLKLYQIPALQTCLDEEDFKTLKLKTKKVKSFLVQVKNSGDKHGIIREIVDEDQAVFVHQTFAEYFACIWFNNHHDKLRWLRETFFSEKYRNLRLIFDVMMGEDNPLHLAVIYKNMEQFKAHEANLEMRDDGARTCFHLVCCHGVNCPPSCSRLSRETDIYINIFEALLEKCDALVRDSLFDFNAVDYAVESCSLYCLEKMSEKGLVDLRTVFKENTDSRVIAYYACQFGYPTLLRAVVARNPNVVNEVFDDKSLLHIATLGASDDRYLLPRKGNIDVIKILTTSGLQISESNIMDFVCRNGCFDMLEPLHTLGAECDDNNTFLHKITEFNEISCSVLEIAHNLSVDINAQNEDGKTALHIACDRGDAGNVKMLLNSGADPNAVDYRNRTALHHAVRSQIKDMRIVELLIHKDVNVDMGDEYGNTALHDACFAGWFECVEYLLEHGANPKILDHYKQNVVFKAISSSKNSSNIIKFLVEKYGFDVNSQCQAGSTALHSACNISNIEAVRTLLDLGCDVNIVDDFGANPLHNVAEVGAVEVMQLLLRRGININAQDTEGKTPLHFAINLGNLELIKELLKFEVNIGITDENKANVLHYAAGAMNENREILNELLQHQFDINAVDNLGRTPLHYACKSGILVHVKMLINKQAKINAVDFDNTNALHYAAQSLNDNGEVLNLLCTAGLDVNAQNDKEQTALLFACGAGPVENVQVLLDLGGSTNSIDNDGNNALHYAATNPLHPEIIILMMDAHIDVNSRNKQGTTPLQCACQHYHIEGVKLLAEKRADVNCVDEHGMNALHYAAQSDKENKQVIKFLIDKGLSVNATDLKRRTPLHFACLNQVLHNVNILIQRGADVNVKDQDDMNLIHYASATEFENIRVLNFLLSKLDVNVCNSQGETPLHLACKSGNYMNVELLLEHTNIEVLGSILHYAVMSQNSEVLLEELLLKRGFDVNARDAAGASVLHCACKNCDYETAKLLIDAGADINSTDEQNCNVLHYAVAAKKPDKKLIKLLIESGVKTNAEQDIRSVSDYALEMECYSAVKILLEENVFEINDSNFLYYAVYSGSTFGVSLFNSKMEISNVDVNNDLYPLYFAERDGELDLDLLLKMTQFIDKTIENFKEAVIKYSHRGLVAFLKQKFSSSPVAFSFDEVEDPHLFNRRFKELRKLFK